MWLPLKRPLLGTWPVTQASALTRNRTHDPLVPRRALSPLSHTHQGEPFYFLESVSLLLSGADNDFIEESTGL